MTNSCIIEYFPRTHFNVSIYIYCSLACGVSLAMALVGNNLTKSNNSCNEKLFLGSVSRTASFSVFIKGDSSYIYTYMYVRINSLNLIMQLCGHEPA